MAFTLLPKPSRNTRQPRQVPGITVTNGVAFLTVPNDILKRANLLSLSKASLVSIMVGEGDDAGSIAITAGSDYSFGAYGNKHSKRLACRLLAKPGSELKITDCEYETGNGHLIIRLPDAFPSANSASAPRATGVTAFKNPIDEVLTGAAA